MRSSVSSLFALFLFQLIVFSPEAFAEKHALLVGINDYANARHLKGSVNDILAVKQVLLRDMGFDESRIQVLTDEQATKANILAALRNVAERSRAGDSVLWYYSGHGAEMLDVDGDEARIDPDDRYDEVIVPYDAKPWPRERAADPNPTMLSDDEIGAALANLVGRKVVVIFDSCHSGSATRGLGDTDSRSLYEGFIPPGTPKTKGLTRSRETLDIPGQVVFMSAAGPLQTASDLGEFDNVRHGAFTASFLRTIQQAGPGWTQTTSWEGLFRRVQQDIVSHGFASQTPTMQAASGLGKRAVEQFFNPPVVSEIADLQGSNRAFEVQLETNKFRFVDGDLLQLFVESSRDGYLYLFDIDSRQKVTQLFPNRFTPQNRVRAGEIRTIPESAEKYQFRAGDPFGRSIVIAIVTTEPWTEADRLQLPTNFQPIAENQKTSLRDQFRILQNAAASRSLDPGWSSQKVVVEIVSKDYRPPAEIEDVPKPAPATLPAATAAPASSRTIIDDTNLSPEDQADLENRRPELFAKLKELAERYSPVFWQDVSGSFDKEFRPWKDFFVRYDFDSTAQGPNWPEPPRFQDEDKRARNHYLDELLTPSGKFEVTPSAGEAGVYAARNKSTGEIIRLDLRPVVYWAVLTTPTHYFFHYDCFKAEDWKGMLGHPGDLEGATVVVDRQTEKVVMAFTLAHDDVDIVRDLDDEPEANIEVLVDPADATRGLLDEDDGRPVDGGLALEATRDGESTPVEHQAIYSETKGHGQHGPSKITKSRYIIYANYLDKSTWTAPSFDKSKYPMASKFDEVVSKHKYELVYIGANPRAQQTMWGNYKELGRFAGGVNPPWAWRDNLFFKTGWWKDPRKIKKIGSDQYLLNPYLPQKK